MSLDYSDFVNKFNRSQKTRYEIANRLEKILDAISENEIKDQDYIDSLKAQINLLKSGAFKTLILGDFNRGKTTIFNCIIGEDLLPRGATPTTGIITTLKYGNNKKVRIYFKNNNSKIVDFNEFKNYYIDSNFQVNLDDIKEAEVEYPLDILRKGFEIADSPGLNDTSERNDITLKYITSFQVIIFVLSATELLTATEEDYLENFILNNGFNIFFLINKYDEIETMCLNEEEYRRESEKIKKRVKTKLSKYLESSEEDLSEKRIFHISSIKALKNITDHQPLEDKSGFPYFLQSLSTFLNSDKLIYEINPALILSKKVNKSLSDFVERELVLMQLNLEELTNFIKDLDPLIQALINTRKGLEYYIKTKKIEAAKSIINSFDKQMNTALNRIEDDFYPNSPKVPKLKGIRDKLKNQFLADLKTSFIQYWNKQINNWRHRGQKEIISFISQAEKNILSDYIFNFNTNLNEINKKFQELEKIQSHNSSKTSSHINVAGDSQFNVSNLGNIGATQGTVIGSFLGGYVGGGTVGGFIGLGLVQLGITTASILLSVFAIPVIILAIIGGKHGYEEAIRGFILEAIQSLKSQAREDVEKKKEVLYSSVQQMFASHFNEVLDNMNFEIQRLKNQLNDRKNMKEKNEINVKQEKERLNKLTTNVNSLTKEIEDIVFNIKKGYHYD